MTTETAPHTPRAAWDGPSSLPLQKKFVFVCGLHRSGTSILFRLLRDHPQVSGFENTGAPEDEGQHLQSVYLPGRYYGGPGRFGFHRGSHLDETSPLVTRANRAKLFRQWARYWDTSAPYLLEKSPPNLVRSRFLQAMFPDSYFICITRHPAAVAYATQKWSHTPVGSLVEHWLACHEKFWDDRPFLRNVYVAKYEEFVHDPQAVVDGMFAFLGLPSVEVQREVRSDINAAYFARWAALRQGRFTRWYADRLVRRLEGRVNRFGYSLEDLDRLN